MQVLYVGEHTVGKVNSAHPRIDLLLILTACRRRRRRRRCLVVVVVVAATF